MQKFTLSLFSIVFISTCFYSCKKESAPPTHPEPAFIRSTTDMDGEIITYRYDEMNRLLQVRSSKIRDNYEYSENQITLHHIDSINRTSKDIVYNIQNGLAVSNNENEIFQYDAEGHLVKKFNGNFAVLMRTYVDGNLQKQQMEGTQTTYTYYTDKIDSRCLGDLPVAGRNSKNPVASKTNAIGVTKYVYQYDAQGRIIRESHSGVETGYTLYDYSR